MLEYEQAFFLHCRIKLRSQRSINLDALYQEQTYSGFIEGFPNNAINNKIIEHQVNMAQKFDGPESKLHFIVPERRQKPPTLSETNVNIFSSVTAIEWLPMVACVAIFHSWPIVHDSHHNQSRLTLVWFQNEFGPPIEASIMEQIKSLDWDSLALDVSND